MGLGLVVGLVGMAIPADSGGVGASAAPLVPGTGQPYGGALGKALAANPLGAAQTAVSAAQPFLSGTAGGALRADALSIGLSAPAVQSPASTNLVAAVTSLDSLGGTPLSASASLALTKAVSTLPSTLVSGLADVVSATAAGAQLRAQAWNQVTPAELATLRSELPLAPAQPYAASNGGAVALLSGATQSSLAPFASYWQLLQKIEMGPMVKGSLLTADAMDRLATVAAATHLALAPTNGPSAPLLDEPTPFGDIVVTESTTGNNPSGDLLFVDLGASNTYSGPVASATGNVYGMVENLAEGEAPTEAQILAATQTRLVVDTGSHDNFSSLAAPNDTEGYGSSGGLGILIATGSDNTFGATDEAEGYGELGGIGVLVDHGSGNTYEAYEEAQGFSNSAGVGILVGGTGSDTYNAFVFAQGVGFSGGVGGTLVDLGGANTFTCTGTVNTQYEIIAVEAPRPSTLCHGDGYGGQGLLVDNGGGNTYTVATSFQAMALVGAGALVDTGGNAIFNAGEWSNAVGVLGVAVLAEGGANNAFTSVQKITNPWADTWIGSNGEGYSGGVGVLSAAGGTGTFSGVASKHLWLPQYACSAGCSFGTGVGIVLESGAGNRSYSTEEGEGAGLGGYGLLLDQGGNDTYSLAYPSSEPYGQGFGEATPTSLLSDPLLDQPCGIGYLLDTGGTDTFNNPVVTSGTRAAGHWWTDGDYGRGADGTSAITSYVTSQLASDLEAYVNSGVCVDSSL